VTGAPVQFRVGPPRTWLVTGGAGFIGSHLVERLLALGQRVRVLDDFSTGHRHNVAEASAGAPERFELVEGDIREPAACRAACAGVDVILHQAALGSVPRSIQDPGTSHDVNVTGFLNVLTAARDAGVARVVYASSSAVYGDHPGLPKVEEATGRPLSPYAVTKAADELYAHAFASAYGLETVGLRYFNVFGPRQDPQGAYAAVIPLWWKSLFGGEPAWLNGDGETSRDFSYVANVVQANLLAATVTNPEALRTVYNVAAGGRTTLLELFSLMQEEATRLHPAASRVDLERRPARAGDIRHSHADIGRARRLLGFEPTHSIREGLAETVAWYHEQLAGGAPRAGREGTIRAVA
jgi:UDP-N-acetylglucosamine/UDP-N-acetylgalactosamine 4-epimerase